MTNNNPKEAPTSEELLDKAQKALTPEQYERMKTKALERIGIIELSSMDLDKLKAELPALAAGDPEEADIMNRLDREFPGIKVVPEKSDATVVSSETKFTEHPMDFAKQKMDETGDGIYKNLVPERFKKAKNMSKEGASGKAIVATVIGGVGAGETVQMAENMTSWTEKFMKDPIAWFKGLFEALFSLDKKRITAFFGGALDSAGITSSVAEKFAGIVGVPESVTKYAKKIFSLDTFGDMNYGDLSKVWDKFQKDPELNLMKELGVKEGSNDELAKVLGSVFGKNNKNILSQITEKGGENTDITKLSMAEVISKISL